MPLVHEKLPGKNGEDAIGSPGVVGGGSGQNLGSPAAGSAGGRMGKVRRLT
jgi:hypothetical protein